MEALLDNLQAEPSARARPGANRLRARLGALVAGFPAADGPNLPAAAPEPAAGADLPALARAPLPLLARWGCAERRGDAVGSVLGVAVGFGEPGVQDLAQERRARSS